MLLSVVCKIKLQNDSVSAWVSIVNSELLDFLFPGSLLELCSSLYHQVLKKKFLVVTYSIFAGRIKISAGNVPF